MKEERKRGHRDGDSSQQKLKDKSLQKEDLHKHTIFQLSRCTRGAEDRTIWDSFVVQPEPDSWFNLHTNQVLPPHTVLFG
jgi:hypothetical protein